MNVTLRQRQKGNKISLYLEYYSNGKREYEYLQMYLIAESDNKKLPKKTIEENKKTLDLAEAIRSKRHVEIRNGIYGFKNNEKLKGSFLNYMEHLTKLKNESQGNHGNWDGALKHLRKFAPNDVTFNQVDKHWLEDLKKYFQKEALTPSKSPLSQNSQSSYYNKVRAALREAVKDNIIDRSPADVVEGIKPGEPEREFLTLDELQAMANARCDIDVLKRAFIFSALTGLRWSDVNKLLWSEMQHSKEVGNYIRFHQKKTKGAETLPINEDALKLIGERGNPDERVFSSLKYSSYYNIRLQKWANRAGITKSITFHCARHTYATLQLTLGTDIYTVSKMLGHKDLKTTQIYAKIIDEKKKDAANRIKLDL
ncbi:MAG: site-specific integrase [Bacteroidota bacterium]|nr:site-specific integrase [Bacteroidota bacterium]